MKALGQVFEILLIISQNNPTKLYIFELTSLNSKLNRNKASGGKEVFPLTQGEEETTDTPHKLRTGKK